MNSHLTRIGIANNVTSLPEWMHDLADHIGAPRVFYRFRTARIDGDTMFIDNQEHYEWVKSHHLRDLAKILGVTRVIGGSEQQGG